jgi:hypothetical protein
VTLSDFLLAKKVSARRFVQHLAKRPPLADEDLARSHEIIKAEPPKVGRVVELARAAVGFVPQPGVLLRWCEEVVRSRDEELREWALDPGQDPRTTFYELLMRARANISQKGDRSKRQLAESIILLGLNLLFARRSLAPLDALRSMASDGEGRGKTRRPDPSEREATKLLARANVKQLSDFAHIITLAEGEIRSAEDARQSATTLLDVLRREKGALAAERDALDAEVQALERELAARDVRIEELAADVEGARTRALQDVGSLKARFRRQIGERLAGLLADAWDAIDTSPPHPQVARERLEIAREVIRGELEWLSKSSD